MQPELTISPKMVLYYQKVGVVRKELKGTNVFIPYNGRNAEFHGMCCKNTPLYPKHTAVLWMRPYGEGYMSYEFYVMTYTRLTAHGDASIDVMNINIDGTLTGNDNRKYESVKEFLGNLDIQIMECYDIVPKKTEMDETTGILMEQCNVVHNGTVLGKWTRVKSDSNPNVVLHSTGGWEYGGNVEWGKTV